ncbi:SOS response-associated peptidase [Undibacterium terreum]|uniref:Abasic site processing protein n=1 Tax=Undibacterium terreum TaxID=1224302 RepID=A0A916XQW3_9BURK|nr:SOS response-associated peptidase family protein [Undibacterium terreum]GGC93557.1 hypothetical protein GCM10011396_46070 [Undibacterium terreum]
MCINYQSVTRELLHQLFDVTLPSEPAWPEQVFQDYMAPIIIAGEPGQRKGLVAAYSMVPKQHHKKERKRYMTMNARVETVGEKVTYADAWRNSQLCLVPMHAFYEPNWQTGTAERWKIGMADEAPFAVAGLYRQWKEEDESVTHAFTQLSINANDHPLMKIFHRPEDEKRSLVIIERSEYDDFLHCKDPERARAYLTLFPAQRMRASASPLIRIAKPKKVATANNQI